jgi:HlyD family secretion protein
MKLALYTVLACAILACGQSQHPDIPTIAILASDFSIKIPAKGELISAKDTPINVPVTDSGELTLAWIKPENSIVKAGELVARFDGTIHLFERDKSTFELRKIELKRQSTENNLAQQRYSLNQEARLIKEEVAIANRFSVDDVRVYSRSEIIDKFMDKEFLAAKKSYLDWKADSLTASANTELALLSAKAKGHSDKIDIHQSTLARLEVTAPQDGILTYHKNWRGEKPRVGQLMYPGFKLASIPALDSMQAKLFVLENEAIGLAIDQPAQLHLDAYPTRLLEGNISQIASIAAPRTRDNPVKYFEVTVDLDNADPTFMMPGQKLTATLFPAQLKGVYSIPRQALFQDNTSSYVYIKQGGSYRQRPVKTGVRSLTRVQITQGLEPGDKVALMAPPEQ